MFKNISYKGLICSSPQKLKRVGFKSKQFVLTPLSTTTTTNNNNTNA